jgi:hypothetical protein
MLKAFFSPLVSVSGAIIASPLPPPLSSSHCLINTCSPTRAASTFRESIKGKLCLFDDVFHPPPFRAGAFLFGRKYKKNSRSPMGRARARAKGKQKYFPSDKFVYLQHNFILSLFHIFFSPLCCVCWELSPPQPTPSARVGGSRLFFSSGIFMKIPFGMNAKTIRLQVKREPCCSCTQQCSLSR